MMAYLVQVLVPTLLVIVLVNLLRPAACKVGLVDYPGGRKRHQGDIPLIGGIVIVFAFWGASLLFLRVVSPYKPLFVGLGILLVVGVLDDLRELAPRNKLLHQLLAAVLMASWGGIYLRDLGDLLGTGSLLLLDWGIPFTLFAAVSVINAYNMSDGIDGLAGGWALITFGAMAYLAHLAGMAAVQAFALILVGCMTGFLAFNLRHPWRQRAAVFLGDAGSMTIGFLVVWFAIELTQLPAPSGLRVPPVVMLWVVGLALLDMFTVTVRRVAKRRNPLYPDRTHLHHVLLRVGLSDRLVVFVLMLMNAGLAAIGIAGWLAGVPESWLFFGFLAVTGAYLYAAGRAWRISRLGRRWIARFARRGSRPEPGAGATE